MAFHPTLENRKSFSDIVSGPLDNPWPDLGRKCDGRELVGDHRGTQRCVLVPGPDLIDNLFWANENDVAWRPDANTVETIVPGQETHTLRTDPQFAAAATKDFSLATGSVARQKDIGIADPIPFASPWPLQPEERAIIPEGDTRDSRQWRHAN